MPITRLRSSRPNGIASQGMDGVGVTVPLGRLRDCRTGHAASTSTSVHETRSVERGLVPVLPWNKYIHRPYATFLGLPLPAFGGHTGSGLMGEKRT